MNVTDIAAAFELSRPAISHHLKILRDAGVLTSEKRGKEVYDRLNRRLAVEALRSLADAIEGRCPMPEDAGHDDLRRHQPAGEFPPDGDEPGLAHPN